MGGATDFKVGGTKQDSRAERVKKIFFCTPTFPNVGGTSKQISLGAYLTFFNLPRPATAATATATATA